MLPDFPEIKKFYQDNLDRMFDEFLGSDPLLSNIREYHYREGSRNSVEKVSGNELCSEMFKLEEELQVSHDDIVQHGPLAFVEHLKRVAVSVNQKRAQMLLEMVDEGAKKVGNVIHRHGQPFSPDHLLELLEKMVIPFDDHGNPIMPVMVVNENLMKQLQNKIPEWEADQEHKENFNTLMKKKKKEWNDRESHRKLVD